jgi:hypothetical protein
MSLGNADLGLAPAIRCKSAVDAVTQAEIKLLESLIEITFKPNLDSVSESEIVLLESLLPAITEEMIRLEKELLVDATEAR